MKQWAYYHRNGSVTRVSIPDCGVDYSDLGWVDETEHERLDAEHA